MTKRLVLKKLLGKASAVIKPNQRNATTKELISFESTCCMRNDTFNLEEIELDYREAS